MPLRIDIPEIPWELVVAARGKLRKALLRQDLDLHDPALRVTWWEHPDPEGALNATVAQRIADPEIDLRYQLETLRREVVHMRAGEELGIELSNIPGFDLIHFGTGPLATAFGARFVVRENDQPFFEPAVHTPEEAARLSRPDLYRDGILPRILARIEYFNEHTQGRVPLTPCDTAGPWSIATQIWHYEDMLEAICTAPETVHAFVDMVTDCILEWYNIQETRIGRWSGAHSSFPWPWLPRGTGIGDDCMVTVSPGIWEEFFLPYNNRIAREYGGLFYHCCMGYERYLASLVKTEGFMGCDAHTHYNDIDLIEAALAGRGVWTQPVGYVGYQDVTPEEALANAPAYIRRFRGKVGLLFQVAAHNRQQALDHARRLLDVIAKESS
jgi:hypothetical protein